MSIKLAQRFSYILQRTNQLRLSLVHQRVLIRTFTVNQNFVLSPKHREKLSLSNLKSTVCLSGIASLPSQIVSYEEVKKLADHPEKLLVDVREPDELEATGKIPTSINIPLKTLETTLKKLTPEEFHNRFGREKPALETEVIFHCKSGMRSGKAVELAMSLGFTNAKNYKGSWTEWSKREGL